MTYFRSTEEPLLSEDETSLGSLVKALRGYKETFKGCQSLSHSFQTPMQRAISYSKASACLHLAHLEETNIERLSHLLPLGLHTHLNISVYELLGTSPLQWHVNVPVTLLQSPANNVMVTVDGEGRTHVTHFQRVYEALKAFQREIRAKHGVNSGCFPAFVYRNKQKRTAFYMNLRELEAVYDSSDHAMQQFQQYIQPPSSSLSVLKAHWKKGRKRSSYYIITQKKTTVQSLNSRINGKMPCLIRKMSDFSGETEARERQFSVFATPSMGCWAAKCLTPLPEVDRMMAQVCRLLETHFLSHGQSTEELVCDFLQSKERKWVFLQCCGCVYSQNGLNRKKSSTNWQFLQPPKQNFISPHHLQAVKNPETLSIPLKSADRRFSMSLNPSLPVPPLPFPPRSQSLAPYEEPARLWDETMNNVRRLKSELKGNIDLLGKYGGRQVWTQSLQSLHLYLTQKSFIPCFADSFSLEEEEMMSAAYRRVLKGDYGIHYKEAVRRIHQNKGITEADFEGFLKGVKRMLAEQGVSGQDGDLAVARFRSFRPFIVLIS